MGNLHPKAAIIQVALIHQFIGRPNRSPVEPPLLGAIGHLIPGQMCGKVAYHLGDVGEILKEALRRHILTDELLQMPVRLERIETDVSTLKENLTTLTNTVNRIGGDVSMLKGSDYESHVARLANRFLRRQLGAATTIFSSQRNRAALATLLDDAETQGNIDADETDELDKTDLILTADGPTDYILAEISITIKQHDVDRAAQRAALGGILIEVSNVRLSGKGRRYRRRWNDRIVPPARVEELFLASAKQAICEISRFQRRSATSYEILRGDSRVVLDDVEPCDLAVFSPPYPNSFDYTDVYNVELWTLGYLDSQHANSTLRSATLSSHVQISRHFPKPPIGSPTLTDVVTTEPSPFTPHVWYLPALTEANSSSGGVAWSYSSQPQQAARLLSFFTPQV